MKGREGGREGGRMNKRSEGRRNYNKKVNGKGGSKQEEDKPCPDFFFFFSAFSLEHLV